MPCAKRGILKQVVVDALLQIAPKCPNLKFSLMHQYDRRLSQLILNQPARIAEAFQREHLGSASV